MCFIVGSQWEQCCVLLSCCLQHVHAQRHLLLHFLSLMMIQALFKYVSANSKTGYCVLDLLEGLYLSHRPDPWSLFHSGSDWSLIIETQMDGCTLLILNLETTLPTKSKLHSSSTAIYEQQTTKADVQSRSSRDKQGFLNQEFIIYDWVHAKCPKHHLSHSR